MRKYTPRLAFALIAVALLAVGGLFGAQTVSLRASLDEGANTLNNTREALTQTEAGLQQEQERVNGLKVQVNGLTEQKLATVQELRLVSAELQRTESARTALSDSVAALTATKDALNSEINELDEKNRIANARLRSAKYQLTVSEDELSQLRTDLDELAGQHEGTQATMATLRTEKAEVIRTLEQAGIERQRLSIYVDELANERDDLTEQIALVTSQKEALVSDYEQARQELQTWKQAGETVEAIEQRGRELELVIKALERQREALTVVSSEVYFYCTGSMEPIMTCLDTAVIMTNFKPEDVPVGAIISYYKPPGKDEDSRIIHRVMKIRVDSDGAYHFWTQGDNVRRPDGYWVPETHLIGYVIGLKKNTYEPVPEVEIADRGSR